MYILFPTELHLKNVYYLYSACSNPTNVVLVIFLSIIIGKGLDNRTAKFYRCVINYWDNHSDNISGIRTRAIELVNVFEMEFRWEKDIQYFDF